MRFLNKYCIFILNLKTPMIQSVAESFMTSLFYTEIKGHRARAYNDIIYIQYTLSIINAMLVQELIVLLQPVCLMKIYNKLRRLLEDTHE